MKEAQHSYNWVIAIIDSCNNDFHFSVVDKMIELFKLKYPADIKLHIEIDLLRVRHWNKIHGILN